MGPPPVGLVLAESGRAVGGTERVVWELATRLPPSRFAVRVWLSDDAGVDELAAALVQRDIGVDRLREVDSRWDLAGMARTWAMLRREQPSVLHIHHVWPASDRYLAALARLAGVPHLVITEHIVGFSHSAGQRALKRRELARADAVTAVCGAVADSLVRDYALDRACVRVVPNAADPVDAEAEWPEARRWRERLGAGVQRPLWVCAARLEEQKGHAVLLDALATLAERNLGFVVALAGEGSLRGDLERRTRALGLDDRIHFLGQVEDVGPLLLAADAVVLPSLWEGAPLTLLEALARERPVVASAVGGVPEVMQDGVHGRLVPPKDAEALAGALQELHNRPEGARQMGVRGAEHVRAEFTWARVIEAFEAVYDEVLGLASFDRGGRHGRRG